MLCARSSETGSSEEDASTCDLGRGMDEVGRSFLGVCVPAALALQPGPQWGSLGAQPPVLLPAPGGAH